MEITGKLIKKLDLEQGTSKNGKEWKKQSFIVETNNEYNKDVCINAFGQDKINQLDKLNVGDKVSILCNIYSREYNGRWYNQIDGYFFASQELNKTEKAFINQEENNNDLPF